MFERHRRMRRGGRGGTVPPQKFWKRKIRAKAVENSGKSHRKFGQKHWGIREKAMGNSNKSNRNSGKSNNFCPKYMPPLSEFSHCFCPNFPNAFARIFHWFCPNFPLVLPEFPIAFSRNSGKSNWELGLLRSDWKFERTCIFCPNFLCPKSPINLKIVYIYGFGRNRYEQIRACYCEQVYDSYRLKERSKLYLHNTSPFNTKIALSEV